LSTKCALCGETIDHVILENRKQGRKGRIGEEEEEEEEEENREQSANENRKCSWL
jgi:hypothetical protein